MLAALALGCAGTEPEPARRGSDSAPERSRPEAARPNLAAPAVAAAESEAATTAGGMAAAPAGSAGGVVQGTPPGGLGGWIGEIRSGLDTLAALARRDAAAAKNQALMLYVTRQEYIEIYYGTIGRAVKDEALAEAVMTAETRFHELLTVANQPDGTMDESALRSAAQALEDQYDRVLARAKELKLDLSKLRLAVGAVQ
jgi:hypothetical protein